MLEEQRQIMSIPVLHFARKVEPQIVWKPLAKSKTCRRALQSLNLGNQSGSLVELSISKMQKSMMLLHILKRFQECILEAREHQINQNYEWMREQNCVLQRVQQKAKDNATMGKLLRENAPKLGKVLVKSQPLLTSEIVLDRLDIGGNNLQDHLKAQNEIYVKKIKRFESCLENANRKHSAEEWNAYIRQLEERVEKRRKDCRIKTYKYESIRQAIAIDHIQQMSEYSEDSSLEDSPQAPSQTYPQVPAQAPRCKRSSINSHLSGHQNTVSDKLRNSSKGIQLSAEVITSARKFQMSTTVNQVRRSIELRNSEIALFLDEIKDLSVSNLRNRRH